MGQAERECPRRWLRELNRATPSAAGRWTAIPEKTRLGMLAISAYTAYTRCMQYTIRNLPARLDEAIRKRAKEEGKSLNAVAVEALMQAFGLRGRAEAYREVSDLAGSWVEDPAVDEALAEQRGVDDEMWR